MHLLDHINGILEKEASSQTKSESYAMPIIISKWQWYPTTSANFFRFFVSCEGSGHSAVSGTSQVGPLAKSVLQ